MKIAFIYLIHFESSNNTESCIDNHEHFKRVVLLYYV